MLHMSTSLQLIFLKQAVEEIEQRKSFQLVQQGKHVREEPPRHFRIANTCRDNFLKINLGSVGQS